jgi:hypothetical protein
MAWLGSMVGLPDAFLKILIHTSVARAWFFASQASKAASLSNGRMDFGSGTTLGTARA